MADKKKGEKELRFGKSWQKFVAEKFQDEEALGVRRGRSYYTNKIKAEKDPKKKSMLQKAWSKIKDTFGIDKDEDTKE